MAAITLNGREDTSGTYYPPDATFTDYPGYPQPPKTSPFLARNDPSGSGLPAMPQHMGLTQYDPGIFVDAAGNYYQGADPQHLGPSVGTDPSMKFGTCGPWSERPCSLRQSSVVWFAAASRDALMGWSMGSVLKRNLTVFRYHGRNGVQCSRSDRISGLNLVYLPYMSSTARARAT